MGIFNFGKKKEEKKETLVGVARVRRNDEGQAAINVVRSLEGQHIVINRAADEIRDIYEYFFKMNFFQDILNSKGMFVDKKKYDEVFKEVEKKNIETYNFASYLEKASKHEGYINMELERLGLSRVRIFERSGEELKKELKTISEAKSQLGHASKNYLKANELNFEDTKFKFQVIVSHERKIVEAFNNIVEAFQKARAIAKNIREKVTPSPEEQEKINEHLAKKEDEIQKVTYEELGAYDSKMKILNYLSFIETGRESKYETIQDLDIIGRKGKTVREFNKKEGDFAERKGRRAPDKRVTQEELEEESLFRKAV